MATRFEAGRVVVKLGVVEVDGTPFLVDDATRVEAIVDEPRLTIWLVLLGLSLVTFPLVAVASGLTRADRACFAAVVLTAASVSIFRVLTASTRYHVGLVAKRKVRFIYSSDDLQTVVFLVAMLRDAIPLRRGAFMGIAPGSLPR